jgi:hypothetical protein
MVVSLSFASSAAGGHHGHTECGLDFRLQEMLATRIAMQCEPVHISGEIFS